MSRRRVYGEVITLVLLGLLLAPGLASGALRRSNDTPFPSSRSILGASWTSKRYAPPGDQVGDILPTVWADDGYHYTMVDDGETDVGPNHVWKQSLAKITGRPPHIHIAHVGDPTKPTPATFGQIHRKPALWRGPLGPYYSGGLVEARRTLYATQENDWRWGINAPFAGLAGIAYSFDHGETWRSGGRRFPAPLGNLNWVIRGRGGYYADDWVYAIATEREFNAGKLILGRSRPLRSDLTDPAKWQWFSGSATPGNSPHFAGAITRAAPIADWGSHITYPQMAYDSPLHQYLLTFTWSYGLAPPGIWRNGSEPVLLAAPHPWGPFSFVAREPYFGPSNGYGAGFPIGWISRTGRSLWLKWAANFAGCARSLNCSGAYGFNYRRLQLRVARRRFTSR
ncbi:MAG: DUF4185 domain-containing protein [Actinomycetota bacterium]|nr:DUF4185 domain-containing protein [Actinomycetota bacterium]